MNNQMTKILDAELGRRGESLTKASFLDAYKKRVGGLSSRLGIRNRTCTRCGVFFHSRRNPTPQHT